MSQNIPSAELSTQNQSNTNKVNSYNIVDENVMKFLSFQSMKLNLTKNISIKHLPCEVKMVTKDFSYVKQKFYSIKSVFEIKHYCKLLLCSLSRNFPGKEIYICVNKALIFDNQLGAFNSIQFKVSRTQDGDSIFVTPICSCDEDLYEENLERQRKEQEDEFDGY